jgi:hypothetical protein
MKQILVTVESSRFHESDDTESAEGSEERSPWSDGQDDTLLHDAR